MHTNYLKIFRTRTKVPVLIYMETVSRDDAESKSIEWEKDLLFQQILHKIRLTRELNLVKVRRRLTEEPGAAEQRDQETDHNGGSQEKETIAAEKKEDAVQVDAVDQEAEIHVSGR